MVVTSEDRIELVCLTVRGCWCCVVGDELFEGSRHAGKRGLYVEAFSSSSCCSFFFMGV